MPSAIKVVMKFRAEKRSYCAEVPAGRENESITTGGGVCSMPACLPPGVCVHKVVKTMRVRALFVVILWMLGLAWANIVVAQSPAVEAPLAPALPALPAPNLLTADSARRALELGFPAVAADLYQSLLTPEASDAGNHDQLVLAWATALLDDGRPEEAGQVLARYVGEPSPAFRLRTGLVAAARGDLAVAADVASSLTPDEVPQADRSWLHYLRGIIASAAGEFTQAAQAYESAMANAPADLARARFMLARLSALLKGTGQMSDNELAALRQNVESSRGRSTGYRYAELYAAALNARGQKDEAVRFLQEQLQALPAQEREVSDNFRLALGLIAGAGNGVGRLALNGLLKEAVDRDKQRIALQLLARASREGSARSAFLDTLNTLIGGAQPHPILEDLLLFRAHLALEQKRYGEADTDANTLLEQFPGSVLKSSALGVLMGSAWERGQFRRAADFASRARAESKSGDLRAMLGVVVAEAYFRALDYRSAADSYAATLEATPQGVAPGDLMFQWVYSEIAANRLEEAGGLIDRLALDERFDLVSRWQSEWNLARALQTAGVDGVSRAYERVNRLLAGAAANQLPVELFVRMTWLQARLAYEEGEAGRALELAEKLRGSLEQLDPSLRADVASSLALLEAQANYDLNRPGIALEGLQRLRVDYPQADAAVFSYVIEAEAFIAQGLLVDAQRVFLKLADDFPQNRFAAYGLLQAALTARTLGQESSRREAYNILERLVQSYPQSDLIFTARFAQGDLLRELNQFASALQTYESLVVDFPRHEDVRAAELAVADCHAALASIDASRLERALAGYERLQFLPTASLDLRLEAGFKHGYALARTGKPDRARQVWWPSVEPMLSSDATIAGLGSRGRYWLARTMMELGLLHEQQGQLQQARDMFLLMLSLGLPRAEEARGALTRLGASPGP